MNLDFSSGEGNEKKIFISCAVRVGEKRERHVYWSANEL
jgi:hypothetical protein